MIWNVDSKFRRVHFETISGNDEKSIQGKVSDLLDAAVKDEKQKVSSLINDLEAYYSEKSSQDSFSSLMGLYNVTYIRSSKPNTSPAGGKWTKPNGISQTLFRTRELYQHILPPVPNATLAVAQAVNVVSLEALGGFLRLWVLLRGDVVPYQNTASPQPLSDLAVQAFFDPPRLFLRFFRQKEPCLSLSIGPKSSVVLDTTYIDSVIRVGKGGTSGTRFVFSRLAPDDPSAAYYEKLLRLNTLSRRRLLIAVALAFSSAWASRSLFSSIKPLRLATTSVMTVSAMLAFLFSFSTGGIQNDDVSAQMAKQQQQKI